MPGEILLRPLFWAIPIFMGTECWSWKRPSTAFGSKVAHAVATEGRQTLIDALAPQADADILLSTKV